MSSTNPPPGLNARDVLLHLRDRAQLDVDAAKESLDAAKQRYSNAIERLAHLQALVGLEERSQPDEAGSSGEDTGPLREVNAIGANGSDRQAVDIAAQVLIERGGAMHYREIHAEIERRGVLIKGSSPANTLLTRMLRDGRFKPSGSRGSYVYEPTEKHQHFRIERRNPR